MAYLSIYLACCIGRQPDSDIWVLGDKVQLNGEGDLVNEEASSFRWVKAIFNGEEGTTKREKTVSHLPSI